MAHREFILDTLIMSIVILMILAIQDIEYNVYATIGFFVSLFTLTFNSFHLITQKND